MKSIVFLLSILLVNLYVSAQEIEWSPSTKASGAFPSYYVDHGKDFYSVSVKGLNNTMLERFENFSQKSISEISTKSDGASLRPVKFIMLQDELIVISGSETDKFLKVFYQVYDHACKPKSELVPIIEHIKPKNHKGFLMSKVNVIQSENKDFFCIQYSTNPNPWAGLDFDYKVLNKEFNTVHEGKYDSNCIHNQALIRNNYLTNSGDLVLGLVIRGLDEKGKRVIADVQTEYRLCYLKGAEQNETNVLKELSFFNSHEILNLNFLYVSDNGLVCTGLYGDRDESVNGAFFFEYELSSGKLENEQVNSFKEGFIDPFCEISERIGVATVSRKLECEFNNSEIRLLEDGSILVVCEKYYESEHQSVTNSNVSSGSFYDFNELVIYRVNPDGMIAWIQTVQKDQKEVGAKRNSGHCAYIGSRECLILFNDNPKNYDVDGAYTASENWAWSYDHSESCLAQVTINLEDGAIKRSCVASQETENYRILPGQSIPDYKNGEMNLFLTKKENVKFGLLKF